MRTSAQQDTPTFSIFQPTISSKGLSIGDLAWLRVRAEVQPILGFQSRQNSPACPVAESLNLNFKDHAARAVARQVLTFVSESGSSVLAARPRNEQ